ncbi:MAG TPA: cbb3-type cytochrome c oxidase subunit I [Flavipsychrobacter sp.]|nr:cbb3-type cytochrome c oxidase subunit I [Flavipsychrobacter sp.]
MSRSHKIFIGFALALLLTTLFFGMIASFAFLYPEVYNKYLPFYQLRPMHVSAALFWIITGATAGILHFKKDVFQAKETTSEKVFIYLWIATVVSIFIFYAFKKFGGREYWEFPPFLGIPILIAWLSLMFGYFQAWTKRTKNPPLYVWQWSTGIVFFLITFLEQNLYQIPWFRQSFLTEITIQWKSNGAMVGAWNQMIYGTALFIMTRILGDESVAISKRAFAFYFIGLTNLMLNWGHHIYNLPATSFIRHTAYAVSMTEWIIFIAICMDFRSKLSEARKFKHLIAHRFMMYAEFWVYLNLFLALLMSIPAINRYTHGTHITVAHAMGATIGINTMILLGSLGYILKVDELHESNRKMILKGLSIAKISLLVFWLALVVAGLLKGYRDVALGMTNFQEMMQPVITSLKVFSFAGISLFAGIAIICWNYFIALKKYHTPPQNILIDSAALKLVKKQKLEQVIEQI